MNTDVGGCKATLENSAAVPRACPSPASGTPTQPVPATLFAAAPVAAADHAGRCTQTSLAKMRHGCLDRIGHEHSGDGAKNSHARKRPPAETGIPNLGPLVVSSGATGTDSPSDEPHYAT